MESIRKIGYLVNYVRFDIHLDTPAIFVVAETYRASFAGNGEAQCIREVLDCFGTFGIIQIKEQLFPLVNFVYSPDVENLHLVYSATGNRMAIYDAGKVRSTAG